MRNFTLLFALFISLSSSVLFAQNKQITGTVTGADDGGPIPGATVVAKGFAGVGTITDFNGKFSLDVPANATVLVFSFVGMETQEVLINGRSVVDAVLKSGDVDIEEVVVMGYVTRAKNSITGSTVSVNSDAIKSIPVVSVDQALQGKVAGMVISTSSGTPGSVQDIRIRGVGSLSAGNDPLFVIDGVPVINSDFSASSARSSLSALSSINSSDIESVTVLKDASATSAYGARGSNGVIVITTKRGKNAKTAFSFSSSYGFQNKAVEGRKALTGTQREELFYESIYNSYKATYPALTEEGAHAWIVANNVPAPGGNAIARGLASTANFKFLNSWIAAGRPDYNWDAAMANDNAPILNLNFSASGGDENSTFYASLGYNDTESIVLGSTFNRVNGSLNYTRKLTKKVKFSTANTVSNTKQDGLILEQGGYFANPLLAKFFMSPWVAPRTTDGAPNLVTNGPHNYLYLMDNNITYNGLTRFMNNTYVEWEIIKDLKYKSLVSMDLNTADYKNYVNRNYGDGAATGGYSEKQFSQSFNMVTQNSLAYTKSFDQHLISGLALVEYQKNTYNRAYAYGESFIADGLTNVASAGANKDAESYYEDWMNASYLGMINYDYASKYIADITFRREGSSRFAQTKRFGNFWSVGAAWNVGKEEFMSNISFISGLKLRASYGLSGNSAIGLNQYQSLLSFDVDYGGMGGVYPSGFGNNNLTWEKNRNYDLGLDFGVMNDRITGSVAYFNKYTYDLLQAVPLSLTSGHNTMMMNVGEVENKGFEFLFNFDIIKSKDFNLNVSLNYATLANEVTKLAKDGLGADINIETGTRKSEVGHQINEWRMRQYAGVNPDTGRPRWILKEGSDATTEVYGDAALIYQGAGAIPTYSGGGTFHVDFKGVYFDANVYFAGGHKVYEDWAGYTQHAGTRVVNNYNGTEILMDRWQKPGDVTNVPIMLYEATANNAAQTSTRFLFDGTFARLKDITLGYNLPSNWMKAIKFQSASVYVKGSNIYTFIKDEGLKYDPEVRADGFTRLTNPPVKSITFGLNLNF